MNIRKKICSLVVGCFTLFSLFAQSPIIDHNWVEDSAKSDEFTYHAGGASTIYKRGLSADSARSKWLILSECLYPTYGENWGGSSDFDTNYTLVWPHSGNGYLCFVHDTTRPPLSCSWSKSSVSDWGCSGSADAAYFTGGIQSNSLSFTYGYYEISAKLPGYVDISGNGHGNKFWPAFWMAYESCSPNHHQEIDIMDNGGGQYDNADTLSTGWGNNTDTCTDNAAAASIHKICSPLCSAFHKYALEWNTDRMIFYLDDVPYLATYNSSKFTMHPMQLFIDLQLWCGENYNVNEPIHDTEKIDYFHYDTLNFDCSHSATLAYNTQLYHFVYGVKDNITLGGDSTMILNTGKCKYNSYVFRATNKITIAPPTSGNTFQVPLGTTLILEPTACH